ncbi:hypothetical protein SYJ56_04785 [Algoriphagus sp. D3-2-R+10]|uniref:hypothetical protein n=1 Tax=Algoriphagus aurantiacus TaxID=3103948 RepID=UPI002B389959|nr:hypothetical protein [Algoriphagus sp. D3-2-R+10]MEB2774609.1 hypothetical protein [Algoriphagus sp. D3-2-R+10]
MGASDFLTILTIGVAVWTVIPKKEKRFYLLFFSNLELGSLVFGILFLHFLMEFNWIEANWIPSLNFFRLPGGIPANKWAYFLALILIVYPFWKVFYGYFPKSNKDELIEYYQFLLNEKEFDLLIECIQKYHLEFIYSYLKYCSKIREISNMEIVLKRNSASDDEYSRLIDNKKIGIGALVYDQILKRGSLISDTSSKYPYVFSKVISGMESRKVADKDFVYNYLEVLLKSLNHELIEELKRLDDSFDSINERLENTELPIMSALFAFKDAAIQNHPWMPIGEVVIKSLKYDITQIDFLKRDHDYDIEEETWNYPIRSGVVFFDYMVRESIYNNWGYHMWMFYFRSFIPLLIHVSPEENYPENGGETPKFSHFFIKEIFNRMFGWIELEIELGEPNEGVSEVDESLQVFTLSEKENAESLEGTNTAVDDEVSDFNIIDTIRCLGQCFQAIFKASEDQIPRKLKLNLLERMVQFYCDYSLNETNPACYEAVRVLGQFFLNPKGVDFGSPEITNEYRSLLDEVWDEFDKEPFSYHGHGWILKKFENEILIPLGIFNQ